MMDEIKRLNLAVKPVETLFVVDSMTGQDAANTARAFNEVLPLTGVILTKTDGDARGGAALSVRHITGKPIKFLVITSYSIHYTKLYDGRVEFGQVDQLHLVDVDDGGQCIEALDLDLGAGLLLGFPACRLFGGLAVLHESRRQGPVAQARLDGAPAQQDLGAVDRQAAGDDARILVVDGAAAVADVARTVVARGDFQLHGLAAAATEVRNNFV